MAMKRAEPGGRARGFLLPEWLTGLALAMLVCTASLSLFVPSLQLMRDMAQRQRTARDLDAVEDHLRREWRRAGLRTIRGPSRDHDVITWSGAGPLLQAGWKTDPTGPGGAGLDSSSAAPTRSDTTGSALRLQQQALQLRTPSSGGFQGLQDARISPVQNWSGRSDLASVCAEVVRWSLRPASARMPERSGLVRRRNPGLLACELPP